MSKFLISFMLVALVGCQTHPTSVSVRHPDGTITTTNAYKNQKGILADSMNASVNQCLASVAQKYQYLMDEKQNNAIPTNTKHHYDSATIISLEAIRALRDVALQRDDNAAKVELARLGVPTNSNEFDGCAKLGYASMVVRQKEINHATLNNLGGKFIKGLKVFGLSYLGKETLLGVLDRQKGNYGDNATVIEGDGNTYSPDNRVNNAGGTCSGEIVDGTCITPIIEEEIAEPTICGEGEVAGDSGICRPI